MSDKLKVLFLCTGNSCRSQMAEGWTRHLKSDIIEAFSAGVETHGLHPNAVKVMAEAGVDISAQQSQHIKEFMDIGLDVVVTVCGHAHESCPIFPGNCKVVHVGFPDPPKMARELAEKGASEEEQLDCFRSVRDEIKAYVESLPKALGLGEAMIVAHRGASGIAPENTIPAFELGWEQGADAIEGDFHLTSDGYIVCTHDSSTKRVADKDLVVKESTLAELQMLDVGSYRGEQFAGTQIPTIAEVFATIPEHGKIYIEIKCGQEIIPKLLEEIETAGLRPDQVVVICFNQKVIKALKAAAPQFKAYLLFAFEEVPEEMDVTMDRILSVLGDISADGISVSKETISQSFVETVQAHGFECHVWTVDDVEVARDCLSHGVGSVTTNVPGEVLNGLST